MTGAVPWERVAYERALVRRADGRVVLHRIVDVRWYGPPEVPGSGRRAARMETVGPDGAVVYTARAPDVRNARRYFVPDDGWDVGPWVRRPRGGWAVRP